MSSIESINIWHEVLKPINFWKVQKKISYFGTKATQVSSLNKVKNLSINNLNGASEKLMRYFKITDKRLDFYRENCIRDGSILDLNLAVFIIRIDNLTRTNNLNGALVLVKSSINLQITIENLNCYIGKNVCLSFPASRMSERNFQN